MDRHGVKPTIAIDAITAEPCPFLVRHWIDSELESQVIGIDHGPLHAVPVIGPVTRNV